MSFNLINRIRVIADYQFGKGAGLALFPEGSEIKFDISKRTGRIRRIYVNGKLVATIRAEDGMLALTIQGAKMLLESGIKLPNIVTVGKNAEEFIRSGRNVFAKFVIKASSEIRSGDEVIVINKNGELLGVGKAVLSSREMVDFKKGVAVKIRRGAHEG